MLFFFAFADAGDGFDLGGDDGGETEYDLASRSARSARDSMPPLTKLPLYFFMASTFSKCSSCCKTAGPSMSAFFFQILERLKGRLKSEMAG